jgi:hypothetical protein
MKRVFGEINIFQKNLVRVFFKTMAANQLSDAPHRLAVFVNQINNLATQSWKKFWPLLYRK